MPDGSHGRPPAAISTTSNIHTTTPNDSLQLSSSASSSLSRISGPFSRAHDQSWPIPVCDETHSDTAMKPKIFGGGSAPTSPTTARPRTGHQSVRGRISGPIPIPNPLDDDEFPMRNRGVGIASPNPIENDIMMLQQQQQQQQQQHPPPPPPPLVGTAAPAAGSPINASFASAPAPPPPTTLGSSVTQTPFPLGGRGVGDILDVPQTVPEHTAGPPGTPTTATKPSSSGPSPDGGMSSVSGTRSSTTNQINSRLHSTNPSSTARYSTLSASSEKTTSTGGGGGDHGNQPGGAPQRKKSTLRSALGRLLRRRKKEGSLSSVSEVDRQVAMGGAQQQQQQQHRSVPPAARNLNNQGAVPAKRVASMPISEFDRALRSHSIGPDDITAIESARNSVDALGPNSPLRKRIPSVSAAGTTPSRLASAAGFVPRSRGEEWAGLSPRPASTHGRGSRYIDDDPDAIGRAITSDGSDSHNHKRRSRSLSQLNEIALDIPGGETRRRSAEIRFWRQSYDVPGAGGPLSPLSSGHEDETENHEDNDIGRPSMSIADSSRERIAPNTPPQPFNFGSLASMNEMAGMKITQAASLDDRFGRLEIRMAKLERVVNQLCHSVPGFKAPFMDVNSAPATTTTSTPPTGGARQRSGSAGARADLQTHHVTVSQPSYAYSNAIPPIIPAIFQTNSPVRGPRYAAGSRRRSVGTSTVDDDDNASSRPSMDNGYYMDSLHPPSSSATQAVSTVATSIPPPHMPGLLRPNSETTVRPATSLPSLGSSQRGSNRNSAIGENSSSNSVALIAQLDAERAARQLLEDQVRKLSERMNNLSTTMFAMVRDPARAKSQERLRPQTANPANGGPTPISVNTAGRNKGNKSTIAPSSKAQSIFGKEAALGLSLPGSPAQEAGEDDFSEAFQTPREEPTPGVGGGYPAFGDEFGNVPPSRFARGDDDAEDESVAEDEEDRKKAARVMSLSQLTMGQALDTRI